MEIRVSDPQFPQLIIQTYSLNRNIYETGLCDVMNRLVCQKEDSMVSCKMIPTEKHESVSSFVYWK